MALLDACLLAAEQGRHAAPQPTADESGSAPLIPGKTLGQNLAQKIAQDVLGRRASAARAIAAKCQECHYAQSSANEANTDLPGVLPGNVPAVWLQHARFDHRGHRHVECRQCHEAAYAFEQRDKPQFIKPSAGSTAARDDEQVMIAGLASCAACHAPARGSEGGARHDCAECHAYHGGDTTLSFPGSSLGTHHPKAPASASLSTRLVVHFTSLAEPMPQYVGASSCASAGCHGDVRQEVPPWRTALTTWAAKDPHAGAYDVLWTVRAREMTRLLSPDKQSLDDNQHLAMLKQRCIGCHATPASDNRADALALGVHCESCHGPAGDWLHAHDRANFSRATRGFVDTKDLPQRAAACMGCHVGPNETAGQQQTVDHDLIASGHPRLTFEFHSYFESLPAHWDRAADQGRHPAEIHFRLWLAGQMRQTEQRKRLTENRSHDFAVFDCFACHHSLAGEAPWRQAAQGGRLQPVRWPPVLLPELEQRELPAPARLSLARTLLEQSASGEASWDAATQAYLATRAIDGDFTAATFPRAATEIASLDAALGKLGTYLATDCFVSSSADKRRPTQYDSPTQFDRQRLVEQVQSVSESLRRLEAAVTSGNSR
jgi:Cytochrome c7 and related cytochrome c/Cytochrome c554 and c-prime